MEKIKIPKRESGISRIIAEPDEEVAVLEYFKHLFDNPEVKTSIELPKSGEIIETFEEINRYMKPFIKRYGGRALDLKPEHLHLIDLSKATPEQTEVFNQHPIYGHYRAQDQAMYIFLKDLHDPRLKIAEAIVHEIMHFQSFDSYDLKIDEQLDSPMNNVGDTELRSIHEDGSHDTAVLRRRRAGLGISSTNKNKNYFRKTDEAVISELTKRFARQYFPKIRHLAEEVKEKREVAKQVKGRDKYAFREETSFIDGVQYNPDGTKNIFTKDFAYPQYRRELRSIIEDLYQKNKPTFSTREEIFEMFARASITGRLLPLARLFEKTYGSGAFKKWAEKEAEDRR